MEAAQWVTTLLEEPYEGKLASLDPECIYLVLGIEPKEEGDETDFDYPVVEF